MARGQIDKRGSPADSRMSLHRVGGPEDDGQILIRFDLLGLIVGVVSAAEAYPDAWEAGGVLCVVDYARVVVAFSVLVMSFEVWFGDGCRVMSIGKLGFEFAKINRCVTYWRREIGIVL